MGIAQYLDQKEVTIGQSIINVFEMAAADRVSVVDTISQFFELPKEEFTKGHELTITALVIQRSIRNSDGELMFNDNQVGEIPRKFGRKAMQKLFDTACELSELEFLQGKSQTESPSEISPIE